MNMSQRPTPETDDVAQLSGLLQYETVNANFARKLERERDEARAERDEARFLLKAAQSALDAIHLEVGGWIKIMKENTD